MRMSGIEKIMTKQQAGAFAVYDHLLCMAGLIEQ